MKCGRTTWDFSDKLYHEVEIMVRFQGHEDPGVTSPNVPPEKCYPPSGADERKVTRIEMFGGLFNLQGPALTKFRALNPEFAKALDEWVYDQEIPIQW